MVDTPLPNPSSILYPSQLGESRLMRIGNFQFVFPVRLGSNNFLEYEQVEPQVQKAVIICHSVRMQH